MQNNQTLLEFSMIKTIRFPQVSVQLSQNTDGNAFSVLAKVKKALAKAGVSRAEQEEFFAEATSGDYDHLLQTCMKYVNVE